MTDAERRFTTVPVEIRAGADNSKRTIGGYAAKFERMSQNLGGFVEKIDRGFFNKSRGDGWPGVFARYNHDDNMVLGTTEGGTLRLSIDDVGLVYDVDLPAARADVYELVQRGDVRKSSFMFVCYEDDWTTSDQGFPMRSLLSGRTLDVAPVNSPAYDDTSVGTRSIDGALASLAKKFEADLAEVRAMSQRDELRKFFTRTDQSAGYSAQAALAKALSLQ